MYVCISYFILYFILFYIFISFLEECSNCRWWIRRKIITTWGTSFWSLRLISWVEGNCSLLYWFGIWKRSWYGHIFSTITSLRAKLMSLTFLNFGFPILVLITLVNACLLSEEIMRIDPVRSRGWSSLTAGPLCPQRGWGSINGTR